VQGRDAQAEVVADAITTGPGESPCEVDDHHEPDQHNRHRMPPPRKQLEREEVEI
jgi:hypothetical protein